MSCLALALQPANGADILLQTREWFPPARALIALSYFRQMRQALAVTKQQKQSQTPSSSAVNTDDVTAAEFVGDDPLTASNGQVIVGVESKYRVVYRLVNSIYVLGVTVADHDNSVNVFECIHVVNQSVSVIVTACRGVEVTPEKLGRKYAEVYMALDIVLRGVSNIRLAAMLGSMHGDGIAKMVHSALNTENKIRGADSHNWASVESHAAERLASVDAFSNARFELPPETFAAGDEFAASLAPVVQETEQLKEDDPEPENKDPFAASETMNQEKELVGGFKKTKDPSSTDLSLALAGLEVTTLPPAEATQSTNINVEGFEGKYGGIEYNNDQASLGDTFESFNDAWGGGLDPSEFMGAEKIHKKEGLGGLELLHTSDPKAVEGKEGILENLVKKPEMKGPEMFVCEEIRAEFRESLLARVGLMGVVYLRTMPPKASGEEKETEFSFRVEGTSAVKRFTMQSSRLSSLGNGMFHVRTAPSEEPIPILKYSLVPKLTPLPLRVRMVKRTSGSLLSLMIQYVSNPELLQPLKDVEFVLKLPVDPTLLKVSPKAILNRSEKELKWQIPEIPLNGSPGRLRARMPLDTENGEEEPEILCYVKFSGERSMSLSGVCLRPATEGNADFYEVDHRYETGIYMCN